jgi:hypothetical protein
MLRTSVLWAALVGLSLAMPLSASVGPSTVTLDMTVNGGTLPVTIQLGETVSVSLYGTVTNNQYNTIDMGLALYRANILTSGGVLAPVRGYDPLSQQWDNQWAVTWAVPQFGAQARGNVSNDDVLGHGAGLTSFDFANSQIAVTRTLLATGYFEGVALGTTSIDFDNPGANVMFYNGGYEVLPAGLVLTSGGASVTVVPEPATLSLLVFGLAALGRRRAVRSRLARLPRAPRQGRDPVGGGGA